MNKNKIRQEVILAVKNIPDKKERSRSICEKFLSLPEVTTASVVALFMSTETEPDTSEIIAALLGTGKRVFVPRVRGDEMDFVEIGEGTVFSVGAYGIKEPVGDAYNGDFDVMAVPLVAFNDSGDRLGHGKGYYDRFLQKHSAYTVGLAFKEQKRNVPVDPWDVPLDLVLYR